MNCTEIVWITKKKKVGYSSYLPNKDLPKISEENDNRLTMISGIHLKL